MKTPTVGTVTSSLKTQFDAAPDGTTRVWMSGAIDENADIKGLFDQLRGSVMLNMRGVERVNSMGVHRWVPLINKYAQQNLVVIDEISYPLVQSANTVANMFGHALVRSCMAPYFCAKCKDNVTLPVSRDEVQAARDDAPLKHCVKCRAPMDFDELDGYFDFFLRSGK